MEYMMQNDLLEHIGRKIKFYRVKRKLTVTQLATNGTLKSFCYFKI